VQAQLIGAIVVVPPEQFGMVGGPPFHGVVTLPHKRKGALPGEAWEVVYTDDTRTYWHPAAEILSWHQAALATFPAAPQHSCRRGAKGNLTAGSKSSALPCSIDRFIYFFRR